VQAAYEKLLATGIERHHPREGQILAKVIQEHLGLPHVHNALEFADVRGGEPYEVDGVSPLAHLRMHAVVEGMLDRGNADVSNPPLFEGSVHESIVLPDQFEKFSIRIFELVGGVHCRSVGCSLAPPSPSNYILPGNAKREVRGDTRLGCVGRTPVAAPLVRESEGRRHRGIALDERSPPKSRSGGSAHIQ
jgi:hypothetical protein